MLVGEIGFLIDPTGYRMKVGNGTDAWSALPYFGEKDYELRVTVAGVEVNVADHETRIVIVAEDISEEGDRRHEAELIELSIRARKGNAMSLTRLSDGAKIEAVRCTGR